MSVTQVGSLTTLVAGTDAKAADLNANFVALKNAFNALVTGTDVLAAMTLLAKLGGSSVSSPVVALARLQYPLLGNNAGGADTDIDTLAVPAAAVNARGKGLRVFAWGTFAANGNAKTVKLVIGNQAAAPINGDTSSNVVWTVEGIFQRGSAANVTDGFLSALVGGTWKTLQRVNANTSSWDAGFNVKWQLAATGASDVVLNGCVYEYLGT